MPSKRAALYVRVSTDKQTVANQVQALSKIAKGRGWSLVETYRDEGISGSKGRADRPGLDTALKDAQRGRFDVLLTWSIDRLGRSLSDLLDTIKHLETCGVDLYIDQQNLDTTTPVGKLMFAVTGAFAEFERSMIRQRVNAGLKRAVAAGKVLGRKPIEASDPRVRKARGLLAKGIGINQVAVQVRLSNGTVQRIKNNQIPA